MIPVLFSRVLLSVVEELVVSESGFSILLFHMDDTGFAFAGASFCSVGGIPTPMSSFDLIFEN